MANDNLLFSFDLSDLREGVRAFLLYKHEGDSASALSRSFILMREFRDRIIERLGAFSFEDAVNIIYDNWGELMFDEEQLENGEAPQCTVEIAKEFSLHSNTLNPGYGLVLVDSDDDFEKWLDELISCNVICNGHFTIHRDKPPVFHGNMVFSDPCYDDEDAEGMPVLEEEFARFVDMNGDVKVVGWTCSDYWDEEEWSETDWAFISGFFGPDEYDPLNDYEELQYYFNGDQGYVVNDDEGKPGFIIYPKA